MNSKFHRLASIALAGAMLAACGSSSSDAGSDDEVDPTTEVATETSAAEGETDDGSTDAGSGDDATDDTTDAGSDDDDTGDDTSDGDSGDDTTETTVADDSTETTQADTEQASVFTLAAGECIVSSVTGEVSDVEKIDCEQPHEWEAYRVFNVEAAAFDQTVVDEEADTGCLEAFEPFVGLDYASSVYGFTALTPTEGSWENGDREIICLIGNFDGTDKTGTAAGTAL